MTKTKEKQEQGFSPVDPVKEIKFAKPEDITQVVAFGYKSFTENSLNNKGMDPSFEKTVQAITHWVIEDAVLVKRNEEDDRYIDGVCAVKTTSTWWSDDPVLSIGLYYVKPEARSYKLARSLLKAAQEYAIMYKLPLVIDLVGENSERQAKILTRLGFKKFGSALIYYNELGE